MNNNYVDQAKGLLSEIGVHQLSEGAWASDSLSAFDKAAARAEGYAQALVDSEQIDSKSTERDLLIIATVDEWRQHHIHSNIPAA